MGSGRTQGYDRSFEAGGLRVFDPTDIDTGLHKRVADAIQDGFIRRFDMRVNSRDGDQDLSM